MALPKCSPLTLAACWSIMAFLLVPIGIVLPVSFTDQDYLSFPLHRVSVAHYAQLFASTDWMSAFGQSGLIGLASAAAAVVIGTACTIGCWRLGTWLSVAIRGLLIVPMIIPTLVYALGAYRLWVQLGLFDSYLGVIIAHTVTSVPYVVLTTSAALAALDPALERAARSLGASAGQSLWRVVLPNIRGGIASGAIFAFMHSWDELVIVLFIASRHIITLPRLIWDGINEQLDPVIAAAAALLICLSVSLLAVNLALTGGLKRHRERP